MLQIWETIDIARKLAQVNGTWKYINSLYRELHCKGIQAGSGITLYYRRQSREKCTYETVRVVFHRDTCSRVYRSSFMLCVSFFSNKVKKWKKWPTVLASQLLGCSTKHESSLDCRPRQLLCERKMQGCWALCFQSAINGTHFHTEVQGTTAQYAAQSLKCMHTSSRRTIESFPVIVMYFSIWLVQWRARNSHW